MKVNKKKLYLMTAICLISGILGATEIGRSTAQWLSGIGFKPWMVIVLISMLPIVELRGSIPIAILLFKIPVAEALMLSIIGNMLPIPLILLFMDAFFRFISKNKLGKRFTDWLFARTRRKGKSIEKYEAIGLAIFVGIPLPGTGAWTGAFAANIFGIKFWRSIICIFLGVLMAAAIVTPLTVLGKLAIG